MRYWYLGLLLAAVAIGGCRVPGKQNLPPAEMLMRPGPGVDGPGPGVMMNHPGVPTPPQASQVAFVGPEGMSISWDVTAPNQFDSEPLVAPGRYNFPQAALYRLKLSNIPGRAGAELYPTLEVAPALPRSEAFLAHNAIPVQFTPEDFDQVTSGNFVTKVIYLPDPEFQELAVAGVETLVSTRLDPGVDPIVEADRRGAILAVIRLGNKDLQTPGAAAPASPHEADIQQTAYQEPVAGSSGVAPATQANAPLPMAVTGTPTTMPRGYISGVNAPQYGMPITGTPIGLPGPPHVPLGAPAGLQKHVIKNHTYVHIPKPVDKVRVDVKETPGITYPKPVDHVRIVERTSTTAGLFRQPLSDRFQKVQEGTPCPTQSGDEGYATASSSGN